MLIHLKEGLGSGGKAIEALGRVKVVCPQLKIEVERDGVLLYPSLTHVPKVPLA
jgi:hypothetical protein